MSAGWLNTGKVAALCAVLALAACAGGGSSAMVPGVSAAALHTLSGGGGGGGGNGGGGGAPGGLPAVPPGPTVDGPAWFVTTSTIALSTSIDFDALPNTVQGAVSIGKTVGPSQVLAFNTSKKTALKLSSVTISGPNAADFALDPAVLKMALAETVPANKGQAALLNVTFTPTAAGARSASLVLVSNAGTATIALSGSGLPNEPILSGVGGSLAFFVGGAPANMQPTNIGGLPLQLNSFTFSGPNASSFAIFVANSGLSNCFAGELIAPHAYCQMAVGPIAGTPAGASATLSVATNDPLHPVTTLQLSVTK